MEVTALAELCLMIFVTEIETYELIFGKGSFHWLKLSLIYTWNNNPYHQIAFLALMCQIIQSFRVVVQYDEPKSFIFLILEYSSIFFVSFLK